VIVGGPGVDTIDGAPGDDVVLDGFAGNAVTSAAVASKRWLKSHARQVRVARAAA
jgi:hypothetical protein